MLERLPIEVIGVSAGATSLRRFVEDASSSTAPVALTGEPGSGKQLAARLIHERSQRGKAPFLMIDCSLYYERELKREIFGYSTSGSGAKSRKGLFEFAHRGTCYLSRIEELSPAIQASLLEFLRTGKFPRLGDGKEVASGVRLIVSSEKNLSGFVDAGLFDAGLYRELSRLNFRLPPLRERREDIPGVVEYLRTAFSSERAAGPPKVFTSQAIEALEAFPWPNNFDDLEKEILRHFEARPTSVGLEQLSMEIVNYWLGQRGDPAVRKVLEELDGYIREFRVLSKLDLGYGELIQAVSGDVGELVLQERDLGEVL
jgi:DNA-binding NtrC family response regulator